MLSDKKLNPIVTELFIRGRKLNISLVCIKQSYFALPKRIRLNSTHYFLMKIPNIRELQQIAFNYSSDIDFQDFMNPYKKFTAEPYSFLVIDTTLPLDNSSRFRKNLLETIKKLIMTIDIILRISNCNMILTEKQQKCQLYRLQKLITLTIYRWEILPSDQSRIKEQAKFTYSPFAKVFEKQIKTTEEQGKNK